MNSKYKQLNFTLDKLNFENEIYTKQEDLFRFKKQEYKNNKITIEEFTKEEIRIMEYEKRLMDLTQ